MHAKEYRVQLIILAVLAVLSATISVYAHGTERFPADLYLALKVQSVDGHLVQSAAEWLSFIVGGWRSAVVTLALAVLLLWRLGLLEAIFMLLAGAFNLVNVVVKLSVNRVRPSPDLVQVLAEADDTGFPSGHAFFVVLVLGLLTYFVIRYVPQRPARIALASLLIILILAQGFSRVYLGAHWPSDVLGAYLIGGFFLTFLLIFYQVTKEEIQKRGHWWPRS